jgi:rhodanese-related sulfurtransferase
MQILEFFQNHWVLAATLVVFIVAYAVFELRMNLTGPKRLSPALATQFMNHQNPSIFDLRDKTKFQAGHILNAQSVTQSEVESTIKQLKKSFDAPILLVCQTGHQSVVVGARLKKQGFTEVACLAGGMNAWQAADLPVAKR